MVAHEIRQDPQAARYPRRYAGIRPRNQRIGRPLRAYARIDAVDEELLDRIGRRMFARDEVGADLVHAMRRPRTDAERVSMAQFHRALEHGIDAVPDAPEALRRFFAVVDDLPEWVDFDLVEKGARAFRRMGRSRIDVLLQLSLIGGYRFGGPPDLLVETGGLTGSTAMRRLGETQKWGTAVGEPGGMRRNGEGFKLTVHVRAMHALINHQFETNGRWDVERWGLPINQTDQAATLGLFNGTLLLGMRALGYFVTREESRAVMHLWKYVGWLMGIDEDWLFDTEREQHVFNYHVLLVQDDVTPAGAALSGALVEGQRTLDYGRFGDVRGRYERQRLLSMLRYFLGTQSLRELDLPVASAWAVPAVLVKNVVASTVIARTRTGRRFLERAGDRAARRELASKFGASRPAVGALPG
ncbi:oxygenase MpaB family protein [Rhodococcus indonesiensis]|uniref:oxygenase MpaB family protein n=1 Tax=Rhodococcus indonesiensis TaxID=3055869 RepID=UPI0039F6C07E